MSSKAQTPRDGKRNMLSRLFNKLRRAPRSDEPASTSTQTSSFPRQPPDSPVNERSPTPRGNAETGNASFHLIPPSQTPTILVEDYSKHHHGDTYNTQNVNGTANAIGTVANATFGTNSVTTIERAFFSLGNEATLLWDTLPKQRDIGGQENEYLEGSREDTVQEVLGWFEAPDSELGLAIQGAAGLGKSTLARHLTYRLQQMGRLAASVSLKALPADARSQASVVKMVSREVGETHPKAIPTIIEAIQSCKGAPLADHIDMFLVRPIRSLRLSHPLAVIFDAVDEYESQAALIKALSSLPSTSSSSIKFILLGRSDPRGSRFTGGSIRPYLLQPVSNAVMERFLSKQFDDVDWERGRHSAQRRIATLAELANGLFIWATVVCSLLQKRLSRFSPDHILDSILEARRSLGDGEKLATLYHQAIVLLFPDADDQDLFREYLTATIALEEPLPTDEFSAFTNLPIRAIESILTELKALQVRQPGDGAMVHPAQRIFHLSLLEYLHSTSTRPSIAFHISPFDSHSKLAEYCLLELPRFLPTPYPLNDLSARRRYAITYLMTHLHHGTPSVQPGSADEWECSLHCALLLQTSPGLLQQWAHLILTSVGPTSAMEECTEGADAEDTGSDVEDIDGGESSDYHGGGVGEQDNGSEVADNENSGEGSVDIVDTGKQDAHEEDWDHGTWLSQLLQDVAWPHGDGYAPRTPFQICCLEVAIRLRPNDVELWFGLGWVYRNAAVRSWSVEACGQAVKAFQNALCGADEPGESDPGRFSDGLATALGTRFDMAGGVEDLDRAIALHRDGLEMRPPGHVNRTAALNNLASSLATYLQQIRTFGGGIDEVIRLQREAIDLLPQGHESTGRCLHNLARYLGSRYEMTATIADLEEAIRLGQESLALCPTGHADRGRALHRLVWDLTLRYEAIGGTQHLEEAIRLGREWLSLLPAGHPDHYEALNVLAMALRLKQEHLDEALELSQVSLSLTPTGSPYRWGRLSDLATILLNHHERSGEVEELEEAHSVCEEALALCPPNHSRRPKLLALQAKLDAARPSSSSP